jgi:hypothetical protein
VCKVAEGTGKEKEAFVSYDFKLRHKLGGSLRESATKLNSGRSVKLASPCVVGGVDIAHAWPIGLDDCHLSASAPLAWHR